MQIILDGQQVTAKSGETIVELARRYGVFIPTLCHDPALEPAAMCRVCTVDLTERGRTRLVTACNFPLRSEVEIKTDTERLRQGRKVAIELLYARCPGSKRPEELGARYGVDFTRFEPDDKQCSRCGLCARVCKRVGAYVLDLGGFTPILYGFADREKIMYILQIPRWPTWALSPWAFSCLPCGAWKAP